ncbi:MAG: TIGR02281 family clan AA aspartic protease [Proteobacteria bacterium]|nr:TIGR02281 family clan AA aspartic protease [Pseudomonadota bacterium]MCH8091519.1 TIGR02281 family clan AA aspartic protease [Pseudomonadota bacterium]
MTGGPWSPDDEPEPARRGPRWWLFIAIGLAFAVLVLYLVRRFPNAVATRDGQVHVVYLVVLATMVGSAVLLGRGIGLKTALRNALSWIAIALVLILGYSFRHDIVAAKDRILAELLPYRAVETGPGTVAVRASAGGHFQIEATVDGVPIRFLVDTGASDVVLRPADARRLGYDLDRLRFSRIYRTANGTVRGAPVTLGEVTVGPIRLANVAASVNGAEMSQSLLGMSFLNRLSAYEVRGDVLTLHR